MRQLERQINSLYFDQLLMSGDNKCLMLDTDSEKETMQAEHITKGPFVLEFLKVKKDVKLTERKLESALIDKLQHFLLKPGKGFALSIA
jgi:predicted nuclease of restriction endonuclease-like (RecB) superfamily